MVKFGSGLPLFVRLTIAVAAAVIALVVLLFVLKIVVFAAVVAAFVVGATAIAKVFCRRRRGAMTIATRRYF